MSRLSSIVAKALILAPTLACERVVDLDLPEGPRRLVIEARLERVQGRVSGEQQIALSTSSAYLAPAHPVGVRGARVQVTDDAGQVTVFTESGTAGFYVTSSLPIVIGRRYTLRIDYDGNRFESTERAMSVTPIDSLYFAERSSEGPGSTVGLRATLDFRDPAGVDNYYMWDQIVDGVRLVSPDSTEKTRAVLEDDPIDGRNVRTFQPYDGIAVNSGNVVRMRQYGLSDVVYRYFRALGEQTANDGSIFAVPLASVRSNVVNLTRPDLPPLGYFQVSEVSEAAGRVP